MSMKYIRDHYGVPAKRGGRVRFMGKREGTITGTVTGSRAACLRIRMDGDNFSMNYHPTWELEYLDKEDA